MTTFLAGLPVDNLVTYYANISWALFIQCESELRVNNRAGLVASYVDVPSVGSYRILDLGVAHVDAVDGLNMWKRCRLRWLFNGGHCVICEAELQMLDTSDDWCEC